MKHPKDLSDEELDRLAKEIESVLPPEIKEMVDACCKNRDELLQQVQEVVNRLNDTALTIEKGVFPKLEEGSPPLREAQRMVGLCNDAKGLIKDLVTELAEADAVSQSMLMDADPDLQ